MIPRRALVNFLLSMAEAPGMNAADTLLSVTPSSFDFRCSIFFFPSCRRPDRDGYAEQAADGRELQRLLSRIRCHGDAGHSGNLAHAPRHDWEGKSDLRILSGGEALTLTWPGNCCRAAASSGICMDRPKPRSGPRSTTYAPRTKFPWAGRSPMHSSMSSMRIASRSPQE